MGADDAQTLNTRIAQRKRAIPHATMKNNRNMTCVLVTALCNQLGPRRRPSRYLYMVFLKVTKFWAPLSWTFDSNILIFLESIS